jgi:hypothetical protein
MSMGTRISLCDIRLLLALCFGNVFIFQYISVLANCNIVVVPITHNGFFCPGTFGLVDYTNYDDMKYAVSVSF